MNIAFLKYKKELFLLLGSILLAAIVSTFITYTQYHNSLHNIYIKQLSVLKHTLSANITDYFDNHKKTLLTLSSNSMTIDALQSFDKSFHNIKDEYKKELNHIYLKKNIEDYLLKVQFNIANSQPKRDINEYYPKDISTQILQYLYIAKNPFSTGSRCDLYASVEKLSYDISHKKYHGHFLRELSSYGFYDIFLINTEGTIVYTVEKEHDFATNLKSGIYAQSALSQVYKKALKLDVNGVAFSDFMPYEPSYNRASSFIATPIYNNGKKIGVLAVQVSIKDINRVMMLSESQKDIGLGNSGEAYLVGEDYYMRSDSRFMYDMMNPLVDEFSTTVGVVEVKTESVKRALNGEESTHITQSYRGKQVFSSYSPINIFDKRWAILVDIETKEVYSYINSTTQVVIATSILLTILFLSLIGYLFFKLILRPIEKEEKLLTENMDLKSKELSLSKTLLNEYKKAVDISATVSKTTKNGIITYVNEEFCKISGYKSEELIGKSHNVIRHPDMSREFFKDIWTTILGKRVWKGIIKNRSKSGKVYYVNSTIIPILNEAGEIKEFISIRHDVTELINKENQIIKQTTDSVTQLPNRQKLVEDVSNKSQEIKLAIIQINKFREVNEFYGIEVGNSLLVTITSILNKLANDEDIDIYKIHSDEFAILHNNSLDMDLFTKKIINIIKYFDHNVLIIDGNSFHISITVGASVGHKLKLLFNSEMALIKAVDSSKSLILYDNLKDVENTYQENIDITTKIKEAIKNDNIVVFVQQIFGNIDGTKEKYECLVRMKDGDEIISPYFFLEIAKKARLYPTITKIVIEKSFEHFKDLKSEFSINLTIDDILNDDIVSFLKKKIKDYKVGHRLIIEMVESEGIENFEEIDSFIKDVKILGCKIAIDDFGTGYSNFEYLMKLNADFIKIDGSLIKNLATDENAEVVVSLIVDFAKRMNIKVIGEFVHNKEVYEKVKSMGIDYSQGYHLGKPKAI